MALIPNAVIWITDKAGVVLEEYQGKYSLKVVQKYQSQGQEKVSYDWVKRDTWNPENRTRETPAKANAAMGAYLGNRDQAAQVLQKILDGLGQERKVGEEEEIPF
jgi:hypothetical protein